MAKFITNSTGDKAVRLSDISSLSVETIVVDVELPTVWGLLIKASNIQGEFVTFETGVTKEAVQTLAAPVMEALEA